MIDVLATSKHRGEWENARIMRVVRSETKPDKFLCKYYDKDGKFLYSEIRDLAIAITTDQSQ